MAYLEVSSISAHGTQLGQTPQSGVRQNRKGCSHLRPATGEKKKVEHRNMAWIDFQKRPLTLAPAST